MCVSGVCVHYVYIRTYIPGGRKTMCTCTIGTCVLITHLLYNTVVNFHTLVKHYVGMYPVA